MRREPWHYDATEGKPPELVALSLRLVLDRNRLRTIKDQVDRRDHKPYHKPDRSAQKARNTGPF